MQLDSSIIDPEIFSQILEMDDGDDHSFSKSLVVQYIEQAQLTIVELEQLFIRKDLQNISKKGHFLKGSSAALGLRNMKLICEKIQYLGQLKNPKNLEQSIDPQTALREIESLLKAIKEAFDQSRNYLQALYS